MSRLDLFLQIYKRERDIAELVNLAERMRYLKFLSKVAIAYDKNDEKTLKKLKLL